MKTLLVLQVVCDRVIFYSQDPEYVPPAQDHVWFAEYDDPLPEGMNNSNCWTWRLRGGRLQNASMIPVEQRDITQANQLMVRNRVTLLAELGKAIDLAAAKFLPVNQVASELRAEKIIQAVQYLNSGLHSDAFAVLVKASGMPIREYAHSIVQSNLLNIQGMMLLEAQQMAFTRRIEAAKVPGDLESIRRDIKDVK